MKPRVRSIIFIATVASATAWASAYANSGRELLFSAPIQKVDRSSNTVTVLGQTFATAAEQLTVGEIVEVYGVLQKDGAVSDAVVQGTDKFGANGDPVFLKGVVSNSDPALGHLTIDGMTVDYTSQLANAQFVIPSIGDVVEISGLQPASQGVLVASATGSMAYDALAVGATNALPVAALQKSLFGASGLAQQTGSGLAQQTGSGLAQQTGSGLAQQTGSGLAQQTGSGLAQQTGSGLAQQTGSGLAQQTGSGLAQQTGSGLAQQTGSGLAQQTGSGLAQQTGSGLAQQTGSGLAQQTGSGLAQQTGSGLAQATAARSR